MVKKKKEPLPLILEYVKSLREKANSCPTNTKESRARKGAYVDALVMAEDLYLNACMK